MRECPWCGRKNLNVYAYCLGCGRGFDPPEEGAPAKQEKKKGGFSLWPFGKKKDEAA
ncbi:MAG: hypothetical protein U5Q44_03815 [Dehalococcoidia bacterium]|nr:hypothetical protein [Dehalococcoidia bacterium]